MLVAAFQILCLTFLSFTSHRQTLSLGCIETNCEIHEQKGKKTTRHTYDTIFIMNQQSLDLFSAIQMHKLVCLDSTFCTFIVFTYITESQIFHMFHLSESSFTCLGLPASGLARRLQYTTDHPEIIPAAYLMD